MYYPHAIDLNPNLRMQWQRSTFLLRTHSFCMASLADDFRFASTSTASLNREEEELDEPIFGEAGPSNGSYSWRSRFENGKGIFDDDDDDTGPRASTSRLSEEPEAAENSELYTILNVEKDCSQEDILKSYRSLAVAFQYVPRCVSW